MESEQKKQNKNMICSKCGCSVVPAEVRFSYLGSIFSLDALRCPECGSILITEELADGKISYTEGFLEDRKMLQNN